jgi:hypothetical protein
MGSHALVLLEPALLIKQWRIYRSDENLELLEYLGSEVVE